MGVDERYCRMYHSMCNAFTLTSLSVDRGDIIILQEYHLIGVLYHCTGGRTGRGRGGGGGGGEGGEGEGRGDRMGLTCQMKEHVSELLTPHSTHTHTPCIRCKEVLHLFLLVNGEVCEAASSLEIQVCRGCGGSWGGGTVGGECKR